YSNSPTYDDVYDWFRGPSNARVHQLRFGAVNLDPKVVDLAMRRVPCRNLGLVDKDALGQIVPAKETNELASIFAPMGLMMLMLMVVMVGATPLLQGVLEEKTNRIAEVLVGSVPPFQLMLGKLLGMVGVSLTIATFYLVGGFVAVHQAGLGHLFPTKLVWWFVVFQSLAVLMYGSLFIAIGAAVTDQKEAQSMMTPLMVVVMSPMFVWMNVVREPTSTLSLMLSLFPPATPMLMLVRQAVPPGIPLWQPALGIVLMVITTLVLVLAAGRIFRVGFLMQGKGARVGEMLRWVFHG
ncbi:MAG: ABC transporter permease, partial [Planctomycetota bacterium]